MNIKIAAFIMPIFLVLFMVKGALNNFITKYEIITYVAKFSDLSFPRH